LSDWLGELILAFGVNAVMEKAAGGEEFRVEEGGSGGAADEIVREQGELYVEERALADAADDGGHAVSSVNVASRLRAVVLIKDEHGMTYGRRQ
jgi:hypothetical protein